MVIAPGGELNISGNQAKYLDASEINNSGVIHWGGTGPIIDYNHTYTLQSSTIINQSGGVMEIQDDVMMANYWSYGLYTCAQIYNAGLLRKTGGALVAHFEKVRLVNTGTVEVQQGVLRLFCQDTFVEQLASSGIFQVAAGAAVEIDGGICTFQPGHQAQGLGFFGQRENMLLKLQGELAGHFDWANGELTGSLVIATNGVLNIMGEANKVLYDTAAITNYGIITWCGSGSLLGDENTAIPQSPTIVNQSGGLFEIQNDATVSMAWGTASADVKVLIQNAGLLRKAGGPGVTLFDKVRFENSGVVELLQGTLKLSSSESTREQLISSGTYQLAAGTAVELDGGI
jgi:hypothetical protein